MQRERQKILGLIDDFDRNRFTILRSITLLRQLSIHPALVDEGHEDVPCAKLGALVEQLEEVVAGGHRALVFSQFTGFLARVRDRLDREAIGYCYLDGRTRKRDRVIERFRQGDNPVFLISLKAGGFGPHGGRHPRPPRRTGRDAPCAKEGRGARRGGVRRWRSSAATARAEPVAVAEGLDDESMCLAIDQHRGCMCGIEGLHMRNRL